VKLSKFKFKTLKFRIKHRKWWKNASKVRFTTFLLWP